RARGSFAAFTRSAIALPGESSHTTISISGPDCARALSNASPKKRSLYAGMRIETRGVPTESAGEPGDGERFVREGPRLQSHVAATRFPERHDRPPLEVVVHHRHSRAARLGRLQLRQLSRNPEDVRLLHVALLRLAHIVEQRQAVRLRGEARLGREGRELP